MISHVDEETPNITPKDENFTGEQWELYLSNKTKKLLQALHKEPEIKWKDDITPIVPRVPKLVPLVLEEPVPEKPVVFYRKINNNDTQKQKKKNKNKK
jgi:hypothetical protein